VLLWGAHEIYVFSWFVYLCAWKCRTVTWIIIALLEPLDLLLHPVSLTLSLIVSCPFPCSCCCLCCCPCLAPWQRATCSLPRSCLAPCIVFPCTLHLAPCTLHLAPCTLHLAPCTLHLAPCPMYRVALPCLAVPAQGDDACGPQEEAGDGREDRRGQGGQAHV
jgi:hypothetical protein